MKRRRLLAAAAMALALVASIHGIAVAQGPGEPPTGQLTWGLHFSPTPTLYEPAETPGLITPFMFLYALHDALAKPMPGKSISPSLAESWTASPDGLVYEFVLRKGVGFDSGNRVTAEDVKFSFERYRGISAKALKDRTAAVEVVDAGRVRFRLKQPWADFLTFYATPATGAAWIVPKKYVEKVGEEGFKKAPIGAGPYRFVSFNPGVELVLEAFDGYWRKTPSVKRLVFKSVPDPATRLAMLKTGEADIAYGLAGEIGEEVRRTSGLTLQPTPFTSTHWLLFADQGDQASPWLERAGLMKSYQEKKLKNIIYGLSGIAGNAATRIEPYATSGGIYAYGGYPDIDGLFKEQVGELDHKKREAVLHRVQQLIHEKVMFLPIWQLVVLNAQGSRVAESGLGLIADYPWSAPYEDVKVKAR